MIRYALLVHYKMLVLVGVLRMQQTMLMRPVTRLAYEIWTLKKQKAVTGVPVRRQLL